MTEQLQLASISWAVDAHTQADEQGRGRTTGRYTACKELKRHPYVRAGPRHGGDVLSARIMRPRAHLSLSHS
jgi:hypothetical protein